MVTKRRVVPHRAYSNDELEHIAQDVIARASGLAGGEFKKHLSVELKKSDKLVVAAALRLAAKGQCYRWVKAKKMRFFKEDPYDTLAQVVRRELTSSLLTEVELKAKLEARHRGFGELLKEWLKGAISRGDVFVHPPAQGSKSKRFGSQPDLEGLLKKVLIELRKTLASTAGQRVQRQTVLEVLAAALGVASADSDPGRTQARERFLCELFRLGLEEGASGLLSVRALRARLSLDKTTFDTIALELARDELVTLHYHDFPQSLPPVERDALIADSSGHFYVGIGFRRTP